MGLKVENDKALYQLYVNFCNLGNVFQTLTIFVLMFFLFLS